MTEEQIAAEQRKRKQEEERRAAILLLFLLLTEDTQASLTRQVTTYLSGSVSVHSLSRTFTGTLMAAHTQATYYGRRLAGVVGPIGEADSQFAASVMQEQAGYITGLLNDLGRSRYPLAEDGSLPGDLAGRIRLYVLRCRGTANEAWSMALPPDTLINWVLGPNKNHCPSCPEFAAGSPYRADALPTTPGSADCICLSACLCRLETVAGEMAFPRIESE